MDIKEFKKLALDLNNFTAKEVDELELMNIEELEAYQNELERDSGNFSDWDHIRALFTFKSKSAEIYNKLNIKLLELESLPSSDGVENYTTGYRNGHKNGQLELIKFLLDVPDGVTKTEL